MPSLNRAARRKRASANRSSLLRTTLASVLRTTLAITAITAIAAVALLAGIPAKTATADVVTDGSTGLLPAGSVASGLDGTGENVTYLITEAYADRSGPNLFIGLSEFNVGVGETATFQPDAGLTTTLILARIDPSVMQMMGRDAISRIDGTIRMQTMGARLMLINPAGVAIGSTARLDVSGSLLISAADEVHFADGTTLQIASSDPIQLTSAAPSEFGFFDEPGSLSIAADQLLLDPTAPGDAPNTLSFIGNTVSLVGAGTSRLMRAAGGRIEVAAIPNDLVVPIDVASIPDAMFEDADSARADFRGSGAPLFLNLDVDSTVGTSQTPGTIVIRGGRVEMTDTLLMANNRSAVDSAVDSGIDIRAGTLRVDGGGMLASSLGAGRAAEIRIGVDQLRLEGAALLTSESRSTGAGGLISIAGLEVGERSAQVSLTDASQIRTVSTSVGSGGSISIEADDVELSGFDTGVVAASSATGAGAGAGGTITFGVDTLSIGEGAQISALTTGDGDAGSIEIVADASVEVDGGSMGRPSAIVATAGRQFGASGSGAGGSIRIESPLVELTDGAEVLAQSFGAGASGDIVLEGLDRLLVQGGASGDSIVSVRAFDFTGPNGTLRVVADRVDLVDGGLLSASTGGRGDAGLLSVTTNELRIAGQDPNSGNRSGLLATTFSTAPGGGRGGRIEIVDARLVSVSDGGAISATSTSEGDAGEIALVRVGRLELVGDAGLRTSSQTTLGGNIDLDVRDSIVLRDGGEITTQVASGSGQGGNIDLRTRVLGLDQSRIIADADAGNGGNISIQALLLSQAGPSPDGSGAVSQITASSQRGIEGVIEIETPEADLVGSLAPLSEERLLEPPLLATPCDVPARSSRRSRLVVEPATGLPPGSSGWLPSWAGARPETRGQARRDTDCDRTDRSSVSNPARERSRSESLASRPAARRY